MLERIAQFSHSGSSTRHHSLNQHTACDYEALAVAWNHDCMSELEKPIGERQKMFPKQPSHIRRFHTSHKCYLNEQATARQVLMLDRGNGVRETVVASREVRQLRQHLQEESTSVRPPVQLDVPRPVPRDHDALDRDPVALLPPELAGAGQQSNGIMEAVARREHLVMDVPQRRQIISRRCLRCGKSKSGQEHCGGTSRTSEAYCTSTNVHEGWVAPPGYAADDVREPQSMRNVKAAWRVKKNELGIKDESIFLGW
jgi:hypothetical protein